MSPIEQVGPTLPANQPRRVENLDRRNDGKRPPRALEDRKRARGKHDAPAERKRLIDELA